MESKLREIRLKTKYFQKSFRRVSIEGIPFDSIETRPFERGSWSPKNNSLPYRTRLAFFRIWKMDARQFCALAKVEE